MNEQERREARRKLAEKFAAEVATWPSEKLRRCYAQPGAVAESERREYAEMRNRLVLAASQMRVFLLKRIDAPGSAEQHLHEAVGALAAFDDRGEDRPAEVLALRKAIRDELAIVYSLPLAQEKAASAMLAALRKAAPHFQSFEECNEGYCHSSQDHPIRSDIDDAIQWAEKARIA